MDSECLHHPEEGLPQIFVDHVWPYSHFGLPFLVPSTVKIHSCGFELALVAISNHGSKKHIMGEE